MKKEVNMASVETENFRQGFEKGSQKRRLCIPIIMQ
jgi:hypothetical protein